MSFDKPSTRKVRIPMNLLINLLKNPLKKNNLNFFEYPSPKLSTISSDYSPNIIEEFEFDLESSAQCFDLPIQQNQQVNENIINNFLFIDENQSLINESQYGLGTFGFSSETLETIQMFNT
ncbi:hypothetical protein C2G38_2157205 [Gigaspora rosea]|uniref:Uncharacterized protein n=1 Tax=Gigaspora rosea TaxID=44941 RepID=A0A397W1Y2_9GLOM|nr:hypothetical protein C2G38_2157205 [Gigaspora rosea]CAG8615022.1 11750_t:CDS:2 [Gigaspora rosea]